jgi:uncharacterized FlaG/YvyC family protein
MDFNLPPLGGIERTGQAQRPSRAQAPASAQPVATVTVDTLSSAPPPHVLEEMYEASKVADAMHEQGRELHFEPSASGRVVVQVRDLDGNVIRTIPPTMALDIAGGAPLE